jgi:hypothetical protein
MCILAILHVNNFTGTQRNLNAIDGSNLHRNQLSVRESLILKSITKRHILQQAKCREQFHFKEEKYVHISK